MTRTLKAVIVNGLNSGGDEELILSRFTINLDSFVVFMPAEVLSHRDMVKKSSKRRTYNK